MKHLLLYLIPLFFSSLCFGQFSLSTGGYWMKENLFYNLKSEKNQFLETRPFHHPGFTIQGDYVKNKRRFYSEIGILHADYTMKRMSSYVNGGGSTPYYSDTRIFSSRIKMTYLNVKFGVGSEFKKIKNKDSWFSFSYNFYGQWDLKIGGGETEHVMYRTTTTNNNMSQTYVTTEYPPNYGVFKQVSVDPVVFHIGLDLKGRYGYKNYFTELMFSLGSMDTYRTTFETSGYLWNATPNYDQHSSWYAITGIKIGYVFKNDGE